MSDLVLRIQDGSVYHSILVPEIVRWTMEYEYQSNVTTVYLRDGSCVKISYDVSRQVDAAVNGLARKLLSPVEDQAT